jgi:pimeloyl-ACP methyl ester carboxylesterase
MPRRSLLLAPALAALAGALLLASSCGSMPREEVRRRLLDLPKNAPVAEQGLETTRLRADLGDGEREYDLVHLRVPARSPVPGARPLLLIHGTPSSLCNWAPVIFGDGEHPGLAEGREVHAIELLGHGFAPGSHGPYSFQKLANFTVAATRALGLEEVHLVGHSYGGEVAWRAALDAPELYRTLTLSDSAGYARADDGWLPEEEVMRENWLADIGWRLNDRDRILSALEPHYEQVPADTLEEFFLVCENADNWHAMIDLVRDENGTREGELGDLALPVLLLWGERDIAYTLEGVARRFEADLPDATLRTLPTGHYPHEERPADYARELSAFLDVVDAGGAR